MNWHIATQTAALFIEQSDQMPESLANFRVETLRGKAPEPNTGYSSQQSRNAAVASCINWITTNDQFGMRAKFRIQQRIADDRAYELVHIALEGNGVVITVDNIKQIWLRERSG